MALLVLKLNMAVTTLLIFFSVKKLSSLVLLIMSKFYEFSGVWCTWHIVGAVSRANSLAIGQVPGGPGSVCGQTHPC